VTNAALKIRDALRAAIVEAGWSETARRSGVGRVVLYRAFPKQGTRMPGLTTTVRVAAALGLKVTLAPDENPHGGG